MWRGKVLMYWLCNIPILVFGLNPSPDQCDVSLVEMLLVHTMVHHISSYPEHSHFCYLTILLLVSCSEPFCVSRNGIVPHPLLWGGQREDLTLMHLLLCVNGTVDNNTNESLPWQETADISKNKLCWLFIYSRALLWPPCILLPPACRCLKVVNFVYIIRTSVHQGPHLSSLQCFTPPGSPSFLRPPPLISSLVMHRWAAVRFELASSVCCQLIRRALCQGCKWLSCQRP